jgi:hypothetical protein
MSVQSRHSARIVSITRSAKALAFGAWIGVRMTRIPSEGRTASNRPVNFASRSRMRNRAGWCERRAREPGFAPAGDPRRVRVRRRRTHVDPPTAELDEREDVERPEGVGSGTVAGNLTDAALAIAPTASLLIDPVHFPAICRRVAGRRQPLTQWRK